jgi:hypothetical protein
MPTYSPPNFNVLLNLWTPPATPAGNPPTFTNIACQLYVYSRIPELYLHPPSGKYLPLIIIRLPDAFPIQIKVDWIFGETPPIPQVVTYYKVQFFQHMHAGFPNRYWGLYCVQCNSNGTIPRVPFAT